MENLEALCRRAEEIAVHAHAGQVDKGGNPYISHPLAVAAGVEGYELKIVALLHDVLEDSSVTAEDLLNEGFPPELVEAIRVLTHTKNDSLTYREYIYLVKKNPIARAVKISDITHNLDLSRIPNPSARDYKRCRKYQKALAYLQENGEP
ncbi:HD domain protein [Marvinbryantia formatexigens DSM 14469]|uniref:HD domain protein n=1 Tax=Marvinbryantia formatexigens DSM 14469 TaxID=478749 RepID=C6LJS5_9FIRM|nr:HD domain-containing protein [Marvinbryantia formatexigens]EET59198.1 HD domain protein [Marvinbryantia formatexigens DSM 14469]UWO26196.1 HD domain-containing protein [Marvinbryantia formatexigens DSM 14469]SDG13053.1 HD domain-containing protein [Marvinbryantia formatexigens]